MASSRKGHRRGATPATLSPHPKPALSLEEWEATGRAPLGDLKIKSVNALKLAAEKPPRSASQGTSSNRGSVSNSHLIVFSSSSV
jgi:hypothetical protein